MHINGNARAFVLAGCVLATSVVAGAVPIGRFKEKVPDEYIVMLRPTAGPVTSTAREIVRRLGGKVITTYDVVPAFHATLSPAQASAIAALPDVESIEENGIFRIAGSESGCDLPTNPSATNGLQYASRWGIDRIDQTAPYSSRLDNSYSWCADGTGVWIYVIDTGVLPTHTKLYPRVVKPWDFDSWLQSKNQPATGVDCWNLTGVDYTLCLGENKPPCSPNSEYRFLANSSHGTSVASIAAGVTFGVARGASVVDLHIFDCMNGTASMARVLAAFDYVEYDAPRRAGRSIINYSATGLNTDNITNDAITATIARLADQKNVITVAAAGQTNTGGDNAYFYSPANANRAITVAALNQSSDTRWQYSNFGYNISFYAPGQFVESASTMVPQVEPSLTREYARSELANCYNPTKAPDTCTSGTSFAAPHVAGLIARYLQYHATAGRDDVLNALLASSATYSGVLVYEPPTSTYVPVAVYRDCN